MIVTASRRAAVLYKETLDELGAPPSECIISGSHNDEAVLHSVYGPHEAEARHRELQEASCRTSPEFSRGQGHAADRLRCPGLSGDVSGPEADENTRCFRLSHG